MKRDVKMALVPKTELSIEDLVLKTDKNQDKVKKVVFQVADLGNISWLASKISGYAEKDGFKIGNAGRELPGLDELPKSIYEIRDALQKGPVAVSAAYRQWTYDDARVSYTFTTEQVYAMEIVETSKPVKKKKK